MQVEEYLLTCMRYIELNPVRANMVNADHFHLGHYWKAPLQTFLPPLPVFVAEINHPLTEGQARILKKAP